MKGVQPFSGRRCAAPGCASIADKQMIQEVSRSLFLQYHLPIFQVADRLRHREGTRRAQPGSPEDLQGLVACAIAIRPRRPVHQSAH